MIPTALLVTVGVFALIHLTPGDPATIILAESYTPEAAAAIHKDLGLDKPLPQQYVLYMGRLLHGDLGHSVRNKLPVTQAIGERLPVKNALIPVVTIIGLQIGAVLEGALVTETVFRWPGVGKLAVESIFSKDFPVVQGIVLMAALAYMVANLLVDMAYAWLDPRISFS